MMQRFKIGERDLESGARDIQVEGELDLAVAGKLDETLVKACEQCEQVLVGLGRCAFIDSSGIRLVVYAPTDQVLRVLSMTGLTSNGLVFDSAEEALAALGASGHSDPAAS